MQKEPKPRPPMLKVADVMRRLSVSRLVVMELVFKKRIRGLRVSEHGSYRIDAESLERYLDTRIVAAPPASAQPRGQTNAQAQRQARDIEAGLYDHLIPGRKGGARCRSKKAA